MKVGHDIYRTLKGQVGLPDQMRRIEHNLGNVATELREHRDRLVRSETKLEVYESLARRRLPKP